MNPYDLTPTLAREAPLQRKCPICHTDPSDSPTLLDIAPSPWILKRCRTCQLVFLENPPGYNVLAADFPWEKTYLAEKKRRREEQGTVERTLRRCVLAARQAVQRLTKRDKLRSLCAHYLPGGEMLDLGCGNGQNAATFPKTVVPVGIEIGEIAAQQALERFHPRGGRVIRAPVLEALRHLRDDFYCGAIAISYFEHEIWPRNVLQELWRVLQQDAPLVVKLPNHACWLRTIRRSRWSGYRFPDHVNYFTPALLERLLKETGFRIARFRLADRLPTSDNMWCVARKGN